MTNNGEKLSMLLEMGISGAKIKPNEIEEYCTRVRRELAERFDEFKVSDDEFALILQKLKK